MHPVFLSEITAARIADWQRQAGRRAIATAARRARSGPDPDTCTWPPSSAAP
jgi:hypothetical protein